VQRLGHGVVREECLLAVDRERADGVLARVREHPVDEGPAELGLDVRMLRRIDQDDGVLVEQARIAFD
jgi:hypothetical protein